VEPIQGRGGIVVPPAGFLSGLGDLCRRRGLLVIHDEIYTGCGRTGAWFAAAHEDAVPDLLCLGKAMSGALPISACLGSAAAMDAWPASEGEAIHTSTFLGNPLACAGAAASLDEIHRRDRPARAAEVGAAWRAEREEIATRRPIVREVRGRGLMLGLELIEPATGLPATERAGEVMREALRRGWILLPDGPDANVLALTPPLTIDARLLTRASAVLDELLA
jgi:4-aminobutyrate aminotransferase-like enzyme